jgi:hypothetical protein
VDRAGTTSPARPAPARATAIASTPPALQETPELGLVAYDARQRGVAVGSGECHAGEGRFEVVAEPSLDGQPVASFSHVCEGCTSHRSLPLDWGYFTWVIAFALADRGRRFELSLHLVGEAGTVPALVSSASASRAERSIAFGFGETAAAQA